MINFDNKIKKIVFLCFLLLLGIENLRINIKYQNMMIIVVLIVLLFWGINKKGFASNIRPWKSVISLLLLIFSWKLVVFYISPDFLQATKNIFDFVMIVGISFFIVPRIFEDLESFLKSIKTSLIIISVFSIVGSMIFGISPSIIRVTGAGEIVERYTWLFYHPNLAGLFGLSLAMVSFLLWEITSKKRNGIGIFLGIIIIILADSRTTLVVLVVFFLMRFFIWIYKNYIKNSISNILFIIEGILGSIAIILILFTFRLVNYEYVNIILSDRLNIWTTLLSSMKNILIGEGLFIPGYSLVISVEKNGFGVDGLFMSLLYNEGIIGLSLFLLFVMIIAYCLYNSSHLQKDTIFVLFIVALVYSITETQFYVFNFFTIFTLGCAGIVLKSVDRISKEKKYQ
ncbi:hypothetical protein [Bacillus pacificus]|uniref:hypothetical protein n=1 Tax=Bacillus pacificus TaxID=2026187 RepID=UPI0021D22C67|nr:hypothetical protein [Bacillus pacificus]MCU5067235.1 hypothetical protein [Bacillus pacificus]